MDLTASEKLVLAQLLVSGDLSEGEFRQMNKMNRTTEKRVCASLQQSGLIGPSGIRRNPYGERIN